MDRPSYIPETPGGSVLMHLEQPTEAGAWAALLKDTTHMPYGSIEALKARGYKVYCWRPVNRPRSQFPQHLAKHKPSKKRHR